MALMERVGTLLRANLNDLIDRAEEPEKMVKQVILDMENQLLQVKTQVAISIADLHLLERKRQEAQARKEDWLRKAELAISKEQEDLARAAIERSLEAGKLSDSFDDQIEDQRVQVDNLKSALHKLDDKLTEARAKQEVLMARHRRSRVSGAAASAVARNGASNGSAAWDRMQEKVLRGEAVSVGQLALTDDSVEDRFKALEKHDEIERLLGELKRKRLPEARS